MSESKTEKASPKKRRDASERGQSFKAKDVVVARLTLFGVLYVFGIGSLKELGHTILYAIHNDFQVDIHTYVVHVLIVGAKTVVPIIFISIIATALPSLLQSGFAISAKAIKFDLGVLNPAKGFKRIFSVRTIKDTIKTTLYLISFGCSLLLVWKLHRNLLFSQVNASIQSIIDVVQRLIIDLVLISLSCAFLIFILDAFAEFFLYLKDLKMDKQEVKREHKEQEGSPEIKGKRRELHRDLLSEQEKFDIEQSRLIIANPTHIAIGIYFNPEITPIPFISIKEKNERALVVRRYAEKVGVPVIVDVSLARRIYKTHKRYSMVSLEDVHQVLRLLVWLEEVEMANQVIENEKNSILIDEEVSEKDDDINAKNSKNIE